MEQNENLFGETDSVVEESKASTHDGTSSLVLKNSTVPCWLLLGQYVTRRLKFFKAILKALRKQVKLLNRTVQKQSQGFVQCVNVAAKCQEQTAKVLNDYHERHALHPAIKAVVLLADELFRLYDITKTLPEEAEGNGELRRIIEELQISASVAHDKLAYLDIEKITPNSGEGINPQLHAVHGHKTTQDDSLHGKINQLLTPGIMYRGKVLRQAKVSVFRYCKVNDEQIEN